MDGDIVDIKSLRFLAKKYDALLYLDEAHSLGIFGKRVFELHLVTNMKKNWL